MSNSGGEARRFAVIIPACNEQECLKQVLAELRSVLGAEGYMLVVGVNGSNDGSAAVARAGGALVAETQLRGYGYGCQAAIEFCQASRPAVDAYVFYAADGANDPRDIPALVEAFGRGSGMVLGCRTRLRANWPVMGFHYVVANRLFGAFCGILTGRFFDDLGPLRLIERELFERMQLREWTFGWTIEAQIRAAQLGAQTAEVDVRERRRLAGEQKVSHVSWGRTLRIGIKIMLAGWRTWLRGV